MGLRTEKKLFVRGFKSFFTRLDSWTFCTPHFRNSCEG